MILRTGLLVLAVSLAACGRVGPISPPGPPERIIYPRSYPAPDRVPRATVLDPAPLPPGTAPPAWPSR